MDGPGTWSQAHTETSEAAFGSWLPSGPPFTIAAIQGMEQQVEDLSFSNSTFLKNEILLKNLSNYKYQIHVSYTIIDYTPRTFLQ